MGTTDKTTDLSKLDRGAPNPKGHCYGNFNPLDWVGGYHWINIPKVGKATYGPTLNVDWSEKDRRWIIGGQGLAEPEETEFDGGVI